MDFVDRDNLKRKETRATFFFEVGQDGQQFSVRREVYFRGLPEARWPRPNPCRDLDLTPSKFVQCRRGYFTSASNSQAVE